MVSPTENNWRGRFWITPNRTSGQVSEIGKWKEVHQNVREPRHIAETRMK